MIGRSIRPMFRRLLRPLRLLALLLVALYGSGMASSCGGDDNLLRAKRIEHRAELIGGPVAMADVGDFLLENDQIRVAILRSVDSPGPGVFGGSVVDIDLRRSRIGFQGGKGRDRFAETFPFANLMVPDPDSSEVSVLKDGSDGQEAAIRVEGEGEFLFEALAILRTKQPLLDFIFPNVITRIRFQTDYILRPGARHIFIRTTLSRGDAIPEGCPNIECPAECPNGRAQGDDGCLVCDCSDALPLQLYTAEVDVFGGILGDQPDEPDAVNKPGILAGDFVFFGNQNDVFAPGAGFDEEASVQAAFNTGRNTFQEPLIYDFVAAAGGDISYGYFTAGNALSTAADAAPVVNVPLFASAATTFLAAGVNCRFDASDDEDCDKHRTFTFERYLAVGEGDIASVTEEMYRVRGVTPGELSGQVIWASGEPVPNAQLFVFLDPDPAREWQSLEEVVRAHRQARGDVGMVNAIDADLGLDLQEDGRFSGKLPVGRYLVVARDADGTAMSRPQRVDIERAQTTVLLAKLQIPATVRYRVVDERGQAVPAKLSFVALDANGEPLYGDGRRATYLGDSRLGNGIQHIERSATGQGEVDIEPGRYRIIVSRGMEYGLHVQQDVQLQTGKLHDVDAMLVREIDTRGWMSADMHLHSTPSFDSGLPIARRVTAVAAEGVELAVSTDHDVSTNYAPTIAELELEPHLTSAVGAEITTLEQGHFIGFPLRYDELAVPTHGAHDWTCEPGGKILDGIRANGDGMPPFTIVAHPRDGFFGYIDQLGVDAYTLNRTPTLLEEDNPVFRTASCNFDGMEIINGKRFDLVRTPTAAEVVDWNRCLERVNASDDVAALAQACPEAGDGLLYDCPEDMLWEDCKNANRTELAWHMMKRMVSRTPIEQANNWQWPDTAEESQALCDLTVLGDNPLPAQWDDLPCTFRAGHIDDFFRYIEHGMTPTQIASSDSHGGSIEPGSPRTYFQSATDEPAALSVGDAVTSLRAGQAFATYGPFVRASIGDASYGQVVSVAAGSEVDLDLEVQTASWFGVDQVEIYLNGEIVRLLNPDKPVTAIQDVYGKITFTVPARDSWVVIVAMGLKDENLMGPVVLDVPYGDVQLAKIAADAFGRIPVINTLFTPTPGVPDWSRIPPYAVTNPIYIDVDGNGVFDAPLPMPDFCSRPCDPAAGDGQCPEGQICLEGERQCGVGISGSCERRVANHKGH